MSDASPPGPDVSGAPRVLGITGALYIITLALFGGRLYTRISYRKLWWDDYTITIALLLAIIEWSLFLASTQFGAGRHNYYIPGDLQVPAQHLLFASTVPWAVSMMFIKISIAFMLLRFKRTKSWLIFLWSMIAIQIASCIASVVFQLVQCVPLAGIWDPKNHPNAVCTPPQSAFVSIYVNSAIAIITDLMFALIPITFIRKMQRPLREKVFLSCLMGLGIFAAAASIVKTTLVKDYGVTGDSLWDAMDLTLWSILEEQSGIIAACIPTLKSPLERILHRIGLLSPIKHATRSYQHFDPQDSHQMTKLHTVTNAVGAGVSVDRSNDRSEETVSPRLEGLDVPPLPQGGIVKTTELHVESEAMSREDMAELAYMEDSSGSWKDAENESAQGQRGWHAV
ncbi:hypothetical protein CC78DRAFT_529175 [Lojkania enalia]|uniref:Rhodopsin domain-containing protein n=1 Tax=Lojkania enalia TaxID=147567 RepID=A0A9P4NA27_9PLEO|nr:hypothetical protein CC78DRAFT_529175 [Didymosphaeria enalia]